MSILLIWYQNQPYLSSHFPKKRSHVHFGLSFLLYKRSMLNINCFPNLKMLRWKLLNWMWHIDLTQIFLTPYPKHRYLYYIWLRWPWNSCAEASGDTCGTVGSGLTSGSRPNGRTSGNPHSGSGKSGKPEKLHMTYQNKALGKLVNVVPLKIRISGFQIRKTRKIRKIMWPIKLKLL